MEYIIYRGLTINYDPTKGTYYVHVTSGRNIETKTELRSKHKLLSVVRAAIDEYYKQRNARAAAEIAAQKEL